MKAIHAIWKDGRIIPTQPVDWPEGTTLTVEPVGELGKIESEGDLLGNDPASIARWTAAYDALPPIRISVPEETEWRSARRDVKDYTVTKMQGLSIEDRQ